MPPKKRQRTSHTPTPTPTPAPASTTTQAKPLTPPPSDPWTDAEEIALFKALMHHKPTGIHKHFRLLALHAHLHNNAHPAIQPNNSHTSPRGIWQKLGNLYDLEALDEREDARQLSDIVIPSSASDGGDRDSSGEDEGEEDMYSEAANRIISQEFALPDGEEEAFRGLMWERRLASSSTGEDEEEGSESECELPEVNFAEEAPVRFVPSFSVEPEVRSKGGVGTRGKGGAAGKGRGKAGGAAATGGSKRRSARRGGSIVEEAAASEEAEEEEGEAEDESPEASGSEESPENAAPARSTRTSRGGSRGRGATVRGNRARARGRNR
ncbi:hypothetical protein B0A50_02731 [Salinomyces thailandicus]|uniref:Chromatin modification-related protein EAF7 n=1 Tax=Salinomyces thailandicus TaxID=706561 RepID=A0A4U0U5X9_9PEZI|nr:hypothetical protein B0A50_02731 [Salinomyces thailandica]